MVYHIQPTKAPFNPNMTVGQIALQDKASFHAFLAIIASIWAATQGSGSQSETIHHKVECVRISSSRLNRREPPSDGTIYAVIWLWALEVWTHGLIRLLSRTKLTTVTLHNSGGVTSPSRRTRTNNKVSRQRIVFKFRGTANVSMVFHLTI
jgi:hypothetical protein